MRGVLLGAVLALCCVVVAGCGGAGSDRLSAGAYRGRLAQISHERDKAQSQVEQELHAKTVAARFGSG